jgi:hypothetical protein
MTTLLKSFFGRNDTAKAEDFIALNESRSALSERMERLMRLDALRQSAMAPTTDRFGRALQ